MTKSAIETKSLTKLLKWLHKKLAKKLLLSHAITYGSSQARTIYGPLRLMQTDHKMMTMRRLIVGLGRAPDGNMVQGS